ncbi:MAG: ATP-dependent DNA helicase RecG [Candidatus Krumholzibacteriia bacterium]
MAELRQPKRDLGDLCQFLRGVGPSRAQRLRNLGIETVNDLLTHFPRKYYDRRNLRTINSLQSHEESCFLGQILTVAQPRSRRGRRARITAAVGDDTGIVQVVWFNQPYLARHLKPGNQAVFTGTLGHFRGTRQIVNPEFEVLGDTLDTQLVHTGRIVPVYPLTRGVSQRFLRELIARALDEYRGSIRENLPDGLVASERLCGRLRALQGIHFPDDAEHAETSLRRLKVEELFFLQLVLSLQRLRHIGRRDRPRLGSSFDLQRKYLAGLPFELTSAQRRTLDEIHGDLESAGGMHRLLQGDVGSGKTVVAGAAMLAAVESGYQGALMAPTEILALQHARTLATFFEKLEVPVSLLIGSLKAAEKRAIQAEIATGAARVVIGTHTLIQNDVTFDNLGMVVIDEQHRFGVRQRAALLTRNRNPHLLVMTATPIPRTLALTAYADLDLSVIDEMPAGRAGVKTRLVAPDKKEAMYGFVRKELERGSRAYFLYPVIDETEKQDLEAAVSAYDELSKKVFRGVPVGLLHGRMSLDEKEAAMKDFAAGRLKLLVTTTVVEVGVHVPEATIMVIHHPERYGLSQLHQLRGRVGRGRERGYCLLLLGEDTSPDARRRLSILDRVDDGFRIAEEDLRIRGPGEFFGVRQHGVPGLKVANPAVDQRLVEIARRYVKRLVEADASLEGPQARPCRRYLEESSTGGWEQAVG